VDPQPPGRRTVAKQAQRRLIRRAAMRLFLEHGYDVVTTAQVAAAAGISPATLFNYFATKEDLFFGQVEELEQALVDVVRSCPVGVSILDVLQGHVVYELTAGRASTDPAAVAPFHHQVGLSPQLQAREAELYRRRERVLADVLVEVLDGRPDPVPARVAAGLYIAAEQIIAAEMRERLTRHTARKVLRDLEPFIDAVFTQLRHGIGDLPNKQPPSNDSSG
jgi:AcrR family transcriptional regulator